MVMDNAAFASQTACLHKPIIDLTFIVCVCIMYRAHICSFVGIVLLYLDILTAEHVKQRIQFVVSDMP